MFGQMVRTLRKERSISQKDLADGAGIDFTYLSKIENEHMDPPSAETIERIAARLDVDATDLLIAAGKIPADVAAIVLSSPSVSALLRAGRNYSPADWDCLAMLVRGQTVVRPPVPV